MMKQQCWKQLRQQLCHKDKWIKDQDQYKCQHCNKQFIPLLRRRHHCRFCGNIFCSNCSDFFLNGKYLGLSQKFIRHCQFCHQKIQKYIKDCSKMTHIYSQEQQEQNIIGSQQQDQDQFLDIQSNEEQLYNLNQIFGENEQKICTQIINKIDQQIKHSIQKISFILCQKFGLDTNVWVKKISQISLKASLQTKMDSFTSQGPYQSSMDIIKQVKIKTIVTESDKITCILLKGIVLQKNLPSKQMSTHLNKPKILLIQNSIDIQSFSSQMKFQQLLKNEKSIMKKIFQKINKLSPDIIFVQGNVNIQAIQYFQQKNICIVSKIKKKDLEAVMQIANIRKTVKKLWLIQKYKPHNILGICDKIYFKTIKQGQTFMFIQSDVGKRTIILGESTQQLTNLLKKTTQLLLRFSRQMILQKYLVTIDNQLNLTIPKNLKFSFINDLNHQIYSSPQNFGLSQQINFTKIVFGQIKYTSAPKDFIQYGQKIGKSLFYQNCQQIFYEKKKIYATGDITLGGYLLLNIALNQKQCRKCQHPHTQRYYFKNSVIVIRFSKQVNVINLKSSFIELDLQNNSQILTLQRLKDALKKQKSKLLIQNYIYCDICQNQISSQRIKVSKNYLQNSFFYFLKLFEKANSIRLQNQKKTSLNQKFNKSGNKKIRKLSMQKCQHNSLSRIFQYSGCIVKFNIEPIQKYLIYQINIKSQQGKKIIQQNQKRFFIKLKQNQISQKQTFFEEIYCMINSFPFQTSNPNSSINMAISTSIKFIQKIQRYQKALIILQNIFIQFKKFKNQYQPTNDWTIFLREIYKFQYLIKVIFQIMEYFQTYLKRKKLNQNNSEQQLSNTSFQDIDQHQKQMLSLTSFQSSTTINNNNQIPKERKQSDSKDTKNEKNHTLLNKIRKQRFPRYQGIFLKYLIGYTYAPVSILACALNSPQLLAILSQNSISNNSTISKQNLNAFNQIQTKKDILKVKLPFSSKIKTSLNLKQQVDLVYKQLFETQIHNKVQTYDITIYFPDQFERLRVRQGVNFQTYVKSLAGCQNWNTSGGKSISLFAKSHNQILVVKIIKSKEFVQFKKFAQDYLNYIENKKLQKKDSLLAKIYGIYQISIRGKQYNLVVMQNLFFGIQNITKVYDLKGSQVNRLAIPDKEKQDQKSSNNYTGLDTNFKIDKDNTPYILQIQQYDRIISLLESDANFLKEQQVIDYSLLAIQCVQNGKKSLKLGIIDFMRPYHIFEKFQSIYKKVTKGNDPTVIPPMDYAQRFFTAMKKYFMKVNN